MNTEHPNIAVLQKLDPKNLAGTSEVLAEDMVWHYFNHELPQLQGDYVGPDGFRKFFEKMASVSTGTFKVKPISATPMGDELVVVQARNTMTIEDQVIEVDAVVVWRIVDGKIKEAWDIPAVYTAKQFEK